MAEAEPRVDRFVIRAPELIASAGDWERLAGGQRLDGDQDVAGDGGAVADTGDDLPEWAKS